MAQFSPSVVGIELGHRRMPRGTAGAGLREALLVPSAAAPDGAGQSEEEEQKMLLMLTEPERWGALRPPAAPFVRHLGCVLRWGGASRARRGPRGMLSIAACGVWRAAGLLGAAMEGCGVQCGEQVLRRMGGYAAGLVHTGASAQFRSMVRLRRGETHKHVASDLLRTCARCNEPCSEPIGCAVCACPCACRAGAAGAQHAP